MKNLYDFSPPQCKIEIKPQNLTSHGVGAFLFNRIARRLKLKKIVRKLIRKKRRRRGFSDVCFVMSQIASFMRGGHGLCSLDTLGRDTNFCNAAGFKKIPDPSTMGEYLRSFSQKELEKFYNLLTQIVDLLLRYVNPRHFLYNGWLYAFCDGTLLEVTGEKFEGAQKKDYNGNKSLLWMCLFLGPFQANMRLFPGAYDQHADFEKLLAPFLNHLKKFKVHFLLDSAFYDHKIIEDVLEKNDLYYTLSVNKATKPLMRLVQGLDSSQWETIKKDQEEQIRVSEVTHWPQGWGRPHRFIVVHLKPAADFFGYHYFILTNRDDLNAREVYEHHLAKGGCENQFKDLLCDMGLHHPPMKKLNANRAFYALASLAFNLFQGEKFLYLPNEHNPSRVHTLVHHVMTIPATVIRHARGVILRLESTLITPSLEERLLALNAHSPPI